MRTRSFIARACFGAASVALIVTRVTYGQDPTPTPEPTAEAERVIITGSHIPTAEEVGPNPVLEISRDLIEKSGERTAADLLRRLPVAGPKGVPTANNGTAAAAGASSISLRGFDASSTLVLMDGRRVAPYPLGTENGAVTFVDLNSIPTAAIESIEILKDSASSTYGADAVAGVVNIKLRKNYRGAEVSTAYGNTLDKDSAEFTASILFGVGDEKTQVTGVLNFYRRNGIFQRDRGFSNRSGVPSFNSSPLNLQLFRAAVLEAGVSPAQLANLPSDRPFFGHAPFFTDGNAPASDYVYTPFRSARYNFNRDAQAVPDSERYGGFINASHEICGEQLVLYSDLLYQNVQTRYELAPTATGPFLTPGNIPLAIPPREPGPTLDGPSYEATGVPFGAFNPFNPFQQIISGGTTARLAEFGNRIINNETDAFLSTLGLKGDKLFDGNWGYDAGFRYSTVRNTSENTLVSASRFNRVLNAADPIFDPASPQFIGTTIPYNPFGDFRRPIPTNALPIDFAVVNPKEIDRSTLATLDLNIYSTSLFSLPAGGVGLAVGGQFRRETLEQRPDQLLIEGDILGTGPGNTTNAGRKTYAFYGEAYIPIVSQTKSLPGIRSLDFTAAARFEEFRNNNTNVLVPKFGVRWQPFDDSLTVRATWGEGFHQPSLIELFGSPTQGLLGPFEVFDPLTGLPVGEIPFIIRGNPNLEPEDSRSFNGGIVYTPKFLPGLTLIVDLFNIESKGRVAIPEFQNVVDRAATGDSLPLESVSRDVNGEIISLELAFQNAGSQKARGIDFGISYQIQTEIGTFSSLTQVTYLDSFQFAQVPGEPERELRSSGAEFFSDDAYLEWKGTSRLDWTWQGATVGITLHYLDGFHEEVFVFPDSLVEHYVSQTWIFDVRAAYTFNLMQPVESTPARGKETMPASEVGTGCLGWKRILDGTTVTFGCNNVLGQDPPKSSGVANYPSFLYDPTGRFVYLSVTKKF